MTVAVVGNFRGKRLFAGRLFAGHLFGPTAVVAPPPRQILGTGGRRRPAPRPVEDYRDTDDDVLLFLLLPGIR